MAVLNTTSPTDRPGAPTESPSNTVPSWRTRIAGGGTGGSPTSGCRSPPERAEPSGGEGIRRAGMIPARGLPRQWKRARARLRRLQQVPDAVEPRIATRQSRGHVQRAAGEHVAVAGAVHQFEALALPGELDKVLADDVAGAQRGVARCRAALLGRRAQGQRGARGRVHLARVVRLDDVAVPALERMRRARDQ